MATNGWSNGIHGRLAGEVGRDVRSPRSDEWLPQTGEDGKVPRQKVSVVSVVFFSSPSGQNNNNHMQSYIYIYDYKYLKDSIRIYQKV